VPATAFAVHDAGAETVFMLYFVVWQEILEIPGRIGGLPLKVRAAAAGRMRETDPDGALEHDQKEVIPKQAVEVRLVEAKARQVLEQSVPQTGAELQNELVIAV